MVALLNATLLRPINRILEDRERRTKGRMTEAQGLLDRVSEKLHDYEAGMREARASGYKVLEGMRAEATKSRQEKIAQMGGEVSTWLEEQKRTLAKDEEQVKATLGRDAKERALEISRQILGRPSS